MSRPEEAMVDYPGQAIKAEGFQIGPARSEHRDADRQPKRFNNPWMDIGSDGISLPAGVHTVLRQAASAFLRQPRTHLVGICARCVMFSPGGGDPQDDLPGRRPAGTARPRHPAPGHEGRCRDLQSRHRAGHGDLRRSRTNIPRAWTGCSSMVRRWWPDGKPTNALPGRVVRGPGYKPGTP